MPRSRARATIRERHSQGRATSSGPRIQPEPSQMPSRQGWRSPDDGLAASSGLPGVGELVFGTGEVLDWGPLTGRLLDGPLLAGAVGELRIVLEEDEPDGADRPVPVLGEDQLR